jgi:hypothetical protein
MAHTTVRKIVYKVGVDNVKNAERIAHASGFKKAASENVAEGFAKWSFRNCA